jgi:hypothetical protein
MKCVDCQNQLDQFLDNDLDAAARATIEEHMAGCPDCLREYRELKVVDAQLKRLRRPAAPSQELLLRLVASEQVPTSHSLENSQRINEPTDDVKAVLPSDEMNKRSARRNKRFWPIVTGVLAASVAIFAGWLVLSNGQPWWRRTETVEKKPIPKESAIRLVRATGDIEVFDAPQDKWSVIPAGTELGLEYGDRVRTPDSSLCELKIGDRSTIRLNEQSEVYFVSEDQLECVAGQVWTRADSGTMQVTVAAWEDFNSPIQPGQCMATSRDEQMPVVLNDRDGGWRSKIWQLPLLAMFDPLDVEVSELLESVLSELGATKESFLFEKQLRDLGPPGAIPLLAYVASESSRTDANKRTRAMRIGSEMASATAKTRLERLMDDPDPTISDLARKAVKRIESIQ